MQILPRRPRWVALAAFVIAGLGLLTGLWRESAELAYIAGSRAKDKALAEMLPPIFGRPYDDVINANTEQALEIERYIADYRRRSTQTLEGLGFDFSSLSAYQRSRGPYRSLLASSLSYPPADFFQTTVAPSVTRLGEDELATYYDLVVGVLGQVHARGIFMMPHAVTGKVPLIIAAHGRGGKPARPKNGVLAAVTSTNRDLALGALKKGYAVWEPTFVFYAEGRPDDIRERLDARAREAGTSLVAIEIAKITGALDAIVRTQQIDPARIAMVGVSYGGFYTLYTAALDDRIRVAVVSAYFNDREAILDSTEPFGMPDWRFQNSLTLFRDPNVVGLVCPRPLQIQAGDHDQLFPVEGVRRSVGSVAELYRRLGIADRFQYVEFVGRHDFDGDEAWAFIERFFSNPALPGDSQGPEP